MQRNGEEKTRHAASNGNTYGGSRISGGLSSPSRSRKLTPRHITTGRSSRSSSPVNHRRISLEEGVELSREPWRQGKVGPGWESIEGGDGSSMGGASSRNGRGVGGADGSGGGYEVVEREEPLLREGGPEQQEDERYAVCRRRVLVLCVVEAIPSSRLRRACSCAVRLDVVVC